MIPRQYICVARDGSKIIGTTSICPLTPFEDVGAIDFLLKHLKGHRHLIILEAFFTKLLLEDLNRFFLQFIHRILTVLLLVLEDGIHHLGTNCGLTNRKHLFVHREELELLLGFCAKGCQFLLGFDDRLNCLMGKLQRLNEACLRKLLSASLDHHHFAFVSDVDQIERRFKHLLVGRIHHEFTVDLTQADATYRASPWDIRDHQCGRCTIHHEHIRLIHLIRRQEVTDHLHFVQEALREKGTQRTVAKTAGQDLLFGGLALTFEVSTRKASGSRELFTVIHGQREEILTWFYVWRGCRGDKYSGFSFGNGYRTVGKQREGACGQRDVQPLDFDGIFLIHMIIGYLLPLNRGLGPHSSLHCSKQQQPSGSPEGC
ncbi:MAG: hypothetical protein BWY82_01963 [Verrucomicrobia bacterium ADurb.Bin474]|nr:MAG: hypothetical protein BWY82_01963 [Verrucomicrobia bacterium ADurb.Bin474]